MAKIKFRRKAILAKVESTYGTDSTPDAATNAILTGNFEIDPWEGESLERELDRGTFGSNKSTRLAKHVVARFRVEAAGSGTATDAPAWGGLMRAAGHSESLETVAGEGEDLVRYNPIDTGLPSLTFYFHHDSKLHKFLGARGSVQFVLGKRTYPYLQFEFRGLYVPVTDDTMPTPDHSGFMDPVPFRVANTDASLFGQTIGLHNLTLGGGQEVGFYETSAEESIELQDRNATFEALFEEPEASTHDFWDDADSETTGVLEVTHGTAAGNIIVARSDTVQLASLSVQDENGIRALSAQGPCVPDSGNPDYEIITK